MNKKTPQYILKCSDIQSGEFRHEKECLIRSYNGRKEIVEYWTIPCGYVEFSRKGIRVLVDEKKPRRSRIRIPLRGNNLEELTVNTEDLEEIL